uniref:Transposon protein, putative, CACTA, En/Spm sub-class n=2 Tax=Oryza sativa subsp. japonica TaxID=39947 RepID=Q9AV04_ORYSJ|nr:putative transposase [Oryza sativa Japonica Group]AAP54277.1 transposon protein, putative, CACTA, En/Spm sub-class [Oryza sativa Japonica Group]
MRTTVPAPPVATHGRGLAALPATLPRTDSSQVQWKLIAVGCTRAVESVARPAYTVWVYHGETYPARQSDICQSTEDEDRVAEIDRMDEMIDDVHDAYVSVEEEDPEPTAQAFFQMLSAATQPLHEHTQVSQLDAITRLLAVKSQYAISIAGFDALLNVICALLPQGHKLPANLYEAKKVLSALNMPYEKIDACPKNCMLFRKENTQKTHCDNCGESRYVEVEDSNGHKKQLTVAKKQGVLTYDRATKTNFIMRVSFLYSIHDLPAYGIFSGWCVHGKMPCPTCMEALQGKRLKFGGKYSFFDCHRQFLPIDHSFRSDSNSFLSNTTVSNEPPLRLSGQEIRARLDNLVLAANGDKFVGYGKDHHWTHISSLWRLPYFHKLVLPHNIDVMHNEKNVVEAIFNTCFDIPDQTKDNVKARLDQAALCNRPELNLVQKHASSQWVKPRADFCLNRAQKKEVLEWFQTLKFPDGYGSNLRRGVNLKTMRINGLKSHDYHIMMERIFPVMFRGYLPTHVWEVLAEVSFFYRKLCAKQFDPIEMANMQSQVIVLVCKLEKIFPPGFFNPMQHLMIHLPYEASMGEPVQFRWNYPIERGQKYLKSKVRNRARVEASIAEAYILDEISNFTSIYFADQVQTIHNPVPRYNVATQSIDCSLNLFSIRGDSTSRGVPRHRTREEWNAAMLYVLTNLTEVDDYIGKFIDEEWTRRGVPTRQQQENILRNGAGRDRPNFVSWFYQQGENSDTTEYYGYIKEIVEISFDGRKPLTLVLFNCHWFDPSKVRYTPRYGLVEVAHASILPKFEPFVLSHQATQVYYMPYPCKSVQDLTNWWVVYKVQPIGRLQVPNDQDYNSVPNSNVVHYFQEDGLSGSFVIDLGQELNNDPEQVAISRDTEDICNDKDLKLLNGSSIQDEDDDDEDNESYCTSSSAEDDEVSTSRDILFDEYF